MNRYPKRFHKANRDARKAIEDGDWDELDRLDAGYDNYCDSKREEMQIERGMRNGRTNKE